MLFLSDKIKIMMLSDLLLVIVGLIQSKPSKKDSHQIVWERCSLHKTKIILFGRLFFSLSYRERKLSFEQSVKVYIVYLFS